jgi:hypothetical protein
MVSLTFDTHKVVKDLQGAGFDETQAEAVVSALGNAVDRDGVKPEDLKDFATKGDIAELRTEMKKTSKTSPRKATSRVCGKKSRKYALI